ncbi:DUF420 domain-containing protein [Planctomicrobium sp. SH661]|uniref:DUF420 domain-containing protein n=1 Tax=Planctomicrobium sp. SH661 TaxID=3448124 RepID=UPI003F5C10AC
MSHVNLLARFAVMLCACLCGNLNLQAQDEDAPAAIVLEPGENPPPFVQLSPKEAPVPWDAEQVGEFQLIDQDGETFTRETLLGEPWIANFVFTRCTYQCPATSRKIMELNQELRDVPVRFVTITVDPEHDTPAIMKEFASIWGAKVPRWRFATGKPEEVMQLIRTGFKVPAWENVGTERLPGMEFAHSNHLIHVDATGRILGRYDSGVDSELVTLRRVIKGDIKTPLKYQPATLDMMAALEAKKKEAQKELARQAAGDPMAKLPAWAQRLPATNALLNTMATVLLLQGYAAVKFGQIRIHKRLMLMAFFVSIAFLACYLSYHYALHHYAGVRGKPYHGTGVMKPIYYTILISHVILATAVPVLAIVTIRNGLKAYPHGISPADAAQLVNERKIHKRWAWITFPIWLYVSVTGVMIYWMLYRM